MSSETTGLRRLDGEAANSALAERNARLNALGIEHDDLDMAISALRVVGTGDDLMIARFKKRKLQIKDEIACMMAASRLPPPQDAREPWLLTKFFR